MTVSVLTFGCRLNAHESDGMAHYARQKNDQENSQEDTIIVNTCTVTSEAERQARQAIRRAHRQNPNAKIIVTGCASERNPESWKSLPGVQEVIANTEKLNPQKWGLAKNLEEKLPPSRHIRALLQVQQGCDHRCTFCVIPFGRGNASSSPLSLLIPRARALVENGHQEIVLTGVDIASWKEEGLKLGDLCQNLLKEIPEIKRLRLSSIDPILLDIETGDKSLWNLIADEPRFMPHLHLSLQAGSDLILKRMKRRHNTAQVYQLIEKARFYRPQMGFGADLIAGFPTETQELFEETAHFIAKAAIPFLHVFPYSERPDTPAARMPALPKAIRQERAALLRQIGEKNRDKFLKNFINQEVSLLLESTTTGHTPEFAPLLLKDSEAIRGTIIQTKITHLEDGLLYGYALSS